MLPSPSLGPPLLSESRSPAVGPCGMPDAPALLECDPAAVVDVVELLLAALGGEDEDDPPPQPAASSASTASAVPIIRRFHRGAVVVMVEPSF
jgi:hypothetical protein